MKENRKQSIMVTRSFLPPFEEYIEEIRGLWESHWLTNMGEKHDCLEDGLRKYLEAKYIVLFVNGHLALEHTLSAMQLSGEVITTPFTFASTTHAIVRSGLTPVFCDIREDDFTLDAKKIKGLITSKTSAILPVHVYGHVCHVEEIENIAQEYGLKVIYDAAHAVGVKKNDIGIGNFGDASVFSFHATKVFNSIEGGAVTCRTSELDSILRKSKNFGVIDEETVEYIGGNAKMNEFQAAMGICNLRYIKQNIDRRKMISDAYVNRLNGIPGIRLWKIPANITYNYSYFPVLFDGFKKSRNQVYEELRSQGIYSRKYFYPLTSDFDCYKNFSWNRDTTIAKYVSARILVLPLYPELDEKEVEKICNIILG